jgi:hypothetical protein
LYLGHVDGGVGVDVDVNVDVDDGGQKLWM